MDKNVTMTAVDGTDALAFVIIRPGTTEGGVAIEAAANGMSKEGAAYVLRHVANQFDADTASGENSAIEDGLRTALNSLAERYEDIYKRAPKHPQYLYIDPLSPGERAEHDRVEGYRKAAADIRDVLRTGRLPHDLMTDTELDKHGPADAN